MLHTEPQKKTPKNNSRYSLIYTKLKLNNKRWSSIVDVFDEHFDLKNYPPLLADNKDDIETLLKEKEMLVGVGLTMSEDRHYVVSKIQASPKTLEKGGRNSLYRKIRL